MRGLWLGSLCVCLGVLTDEVRGEEVLWKPAGQSSAAPTISQPATCTGRAATLGRPTPAATLDRPVPIGSSQPQSPHSSLTQTSFSDANPPPSSPVVRGQNPEFGGPSLAPPPGYAGFPGGPEEKYNAGVVVNPPGRGGSGGSGFWDHCCDSFGCFSGGERGMFQSDHCFDNFASPVTNPFLFEDPRALTEIRPIFMLQGTPGGPFPFNGGTVGFIGTQARVAFTERLSLVINKLGFVWTDPNHAAPGSPFEDRMGFAEFWISPKYTFIRNENTGTLGAFGVTLQVPAGSSKVFQDTGSLGLVLPYLSLAQNFGRTDYGSWNAMTTFGYSFGTTHARTDYLYLSGHLDYDVLNAHKFYPLLEMHWFNNTQAGDASAFGFEGRDLFNFGSTAVSGRNYVYLAPGFRYKFSECVQTGVGVEFPVTRPHDLLDYRLTWDWIFRY